MTEKTAQDDEQKSVCRRSRKDEQGRDFKCGCGKKYLSYPALYTHIKTKHQGKQPEGTQKTGVNSNFKRNKPKFQTEAWKDITSYFEREDLRVLNELDPCFQGYVPLNSRLKKQNIPKQLFNCYNQLMKQSNVKISRNSSLDLILVIYLLNVGQYVCDKLFDQFLLFTKILRSCYLNHGQQVYKACFSDKNSSIDYLSTFSIEECKYVPIICDFMIRLYIPNEFKDINSSLIQLMLFDFCLWMKKRCLTCIEVNLQKPYYLQQKLIVVSSIKKIEQNKQTDIFMRREQQKQNSVISSQKRLQDQDQDENENNYSQQESDDNKTEEHQEIEEIQDELFQRDEINQEKN